MVELALLTKDGLRMKLEIHKMLNSGTPAEDDWPTGLSAMRRTMCGESDVLILLGGCVQGYKGSMLRMAKDTIDIDYHCSWFFAHNS